MARQLAFAGLHVAMVTCFDKQNKINPTAQKQLIHYLIKEQQIDGIVACASTGEGALLSEAEYWQVAELCLTEAKQIKPNLKVLLGTSHLDPVVTAARNKQAKAMGFDAVLVTHPPYSKPDQRGIKAFFQYLTQQVPGLPMIVYNIWYRTGGKGIHADILIDLAQLPDIHGVKDAGVTLEHVDKVLQNTQGQSFSYLCGEDNMYYDFLTHAGHGAISVLPHVLGKPLQTIRTQLQEGQLQPALTLFRQIEPLIGLLFAEPNPAPMKALLTKVGIDTGAPRLPLLPITTNLADKLVHEFSMLQAKGLL